MPKKITTLAFTLFALLVSVPAFASGHQLEALGTLEIYFYILLIVIIGVLLLNLVIAILFVIKKSKALGIFGWILTAISFGIITTIGIIGFRGFFVCIILPILSAALLIRGELAKQSEAIDSPAAIKIKGGSLLRSTILYTIVSLGIYLFTQFVLVKHISSSYVSVIVMPLTIINYFILFWLIRKALIGRRAESGSIDIRHGILYGVIIFLPADIINSIITYVNLQRFFHKYLLIGIVTNLLYAAIIGVIAYYLVPKKKDRMETSPEVEAKS